MGYWVYLARCGNNTIYTGATTDLLRREREHNGGTGKRTGAKYTAAHPPVILVQAWEVGSWNDALRLEYALKKCTRAQKDQLIERGEMIYKIAKLRKLNFAIMEIGEDLKDFIESNKVIDLRGGN